MTVTQPDRAVSHVVPCCPWRSQMPPRCAPTPSATSSGSSWRRASRSPSTGSTSASRRSPAAPASARPRSSAASRPRTRSSSPSSRASSSTWRSPPSAPPRWTTRGRALRLVHGRARAGCRPTTRASSTRWPPASARASGSRRSSSIARWAPPRPVLEPAQRAGLVREGVTGGDLMAMLKMLGPAIRPSRACASTRRLEPLPRAAAVGHPRGAAAAARRLDGLLRPGAPGRAAVGLSGRRARRTRW